MEQLISLIAFAGIILSVGAGVAVAVLARKLREASNNQQVLANDINYRLNEIRHNLEAVAQHTSAQLQRISQPIPQSVPLTVEPTAVTAVAAAAQQATGPRQSVTERRHRVLTLARRGMDVKAIAQTLGMPHGEVALIIRMSNPRFGD